MLTSVARKTLMAMTGLFLCLFLVVHLLGNLQLFLPQSTAGAQFNWYAGFLSELLVIEIAAWLVYFGVLAHVLLAIVLALRNRRSVGVGYEDEAPVALAPWYSRFMGVLGVIVLVFLVVHLKDFWFPFKFGADLGTDSEGHRDLFGLVVHEFQKGWKVSLYVVGVLAVGFHLLHGFYSAVRSLGVSHRGYAKWLRWLGYAFAALLTIGFGAMPIYLYLVS